MSAETPWDTPQLFDNMTLREVLARKAKGLSTSSCNLWDGNIKWANKTIDPFAETATATMVRCLYSGVGMRTYSLDHVVYLRRTVTTFRLIAYEVDEDNASYFTIATILEVDVPGALRRDGSMRTKACRRLASLTADMEGWCWKLERVREGA